MTEQALELFQQLTAEDKEKMLALAKRLYAEQAN